MEVNVEGVYVGNSEVYHCANAIFSKQSIKMTLNKPEPYDDQKEDILILKKNIVELKASKLCPFPVICLKLKDQVCQQIRERLGVKFNSRSKDMAEVWMLIYYNFTSFEVPKYLASNYIDEKNFLSFEEMTKLIKLPPIKSLNDVVLTILRVREKRGEPGPEICHQANAMIVLPEVRFSAKKFANYVSDVMEGCAVKGKDIQPEVDPAVFSASDMKQMDESYKSCLVCTTCQEEAILKCKGCKVSRYCSHSCQDKNWSKHKEVCSILLAKRKEKEIQDSLMNKHLVNVCVPKQETCSIDCVDPWKNRIPFQVWEKKFTLWMREGIREQVMENIRQKEMYACDEDDDSL